MRSRYHLGLSALAAALSTVPCSHGATLQHDLFARPTLEELKPRQSQTVKTMTATIPTPDWKPELKAIITGGGTAIVNVEGRILHMGQEIDGYRLVEVQERRAIFVRNKTRHTLVLNAVKAANAPGGATSPGIAGVKASDVLSPTNAPKPDASTLPPSAATPPERSGG